MALSMPLYHHFIPDSVQYTHFMLFTGVAYSITAFPVLCRILTELKLLDTTVGIVVLSAGVGNDIGEIFVAPIDFTDLSEKKSWLDTPGSQHCTCQRRLWPHGTLRPSHMCGMDDFSSLPCKICS